MRLTKEQVEQLHETFRADTNGLAEVDVEYDGLGRLRTYAVETIEKRHPIKLKSGAVEKP